MELLIVFGVIVLIGLFVMMIYNRLVALRQTTRQAWGDIDVQLKQRHDLVPNLVETVKGYATGENVKGRGERRPCRNRRRRRQRT